MDEMPVPILRALEMFKVTLARGCPEAGPFWRQPKGGAVRVKWMPSTKSYRFVLDLIPPLPFPEDA